MVNFTVADLRNDENFRRAEERSQFTIPKKLYHKMTAFPKVPWIVATDLYAMAVRMTLMMYNVEILIDAGSRTNSVQPIYEYVNNYVSGDLDYVIVTHAHQDHYAGFATGENTDSLFDLFTVKTIIKY